MEYEYLHEHRIVVNRLEKKIWLNPDGISKLTLIGITKVKNIAKDDLQEQDRSAFIRSLNLKIHGQSKNGYWFDQDAINGILKSASPKSYSLEEQCDNMKKVLAQYKLDELFRVGRIGQCLQIWPRNSGQVVDMVAHSLAQRNETETVRVERPNEVGFADEEFISSFIEDPQHHHLSYYGYGTKAELTIVRDAEDSEVESDPLLSSAYSKDMDVEQVGDDPSLRSRSNASNSNSSEESSNSDSSIHGLSGESGST